MPGAVSTEGIEAAWAAIPPEFRDTPQFVSEALARELGVRLTVKVECLNPIRSFKARGACWFTARRGSEAKQAGISWVTGSAGNFGQGLAWAARRAGIPLTVFSATAANPAKVAAMRSLGAEVVLRGEDFDAAKEEARAFAEGGNAVFVEDGREPEITEGAGTIALELTRSAPVEHLLVPVGNGALVGGMGKWFRQALPESRIVGVVAAGAPVMRRAFESGDPAAAEAPPRTAADGIAVRVPVPEAVVLMREVVDEVVEVSEESLHDAVRLLHRTLGLVVEPAGAAGVAALLDHSDRLRRLFGGLPVATPLCGGNADPALLR